MPSSPKFRRSLSAPEVLGSDREKEDTRGACLSDDDDDLLNGALSGGEEFADRPVSMVVCPTSGGLVHFSSQFFVTRLLGVLGVRVKRHRILAISQASFHVIGLVHMPRLILYVTRTQQLCTSQPAKQLHTFPAVVLKPQHGDVFTGVH